MSIGRTACATRGSSFSFLNMYTSGRDILLPEGLHNRDTVRSGNLLAKRTVRVMNLQFFLGSIDTFISCLWFQELPSYAVGQGNECVLPHGATSSRC